MTTFDDRENAFENKFAHDADLQFRAQARCEGSGAAAVSAAAQHGGE